MDVMEVSQIHTIKRILEEINLGMLINNFNDQKIDTLETCTMLDDRQLERLGLVTIGDRVRFRDSVSRAQARTSEPSSSTSTEPIVPASLFRPSSRSASRSTKSKKKIRTWTSTFLCLADKEMDKVPNSSVKSELQKAGLGQKRIQLNATDSSEVVRETLTSSFGFPKLAFGGGFELLTCQSNCKMLTVITTSWDVQSLKSTVGSQTKIYIRPIQHNLDTSCLDIEEQSNERALKEECKLCFKQIYMTELRDHIKNCKSETNEIDNERGLTQLQTNESPGNHENDDELPDPAPLPIINAPSRRETSANQIIAQIQVPVIDLQSTDENDTVHVVDLGIVAQPIQTSEQSETEVPLAADETHEEDILQIAKDCVAFCDSNRITDPTEILRYLQSQIVTGRKLDLESVSRNEEGETNFICIDRTNLLMTSFEEIGAITDYRKTLEVQFYDESAIDLGGPRKEFFALILHEINDKYFDPIREFSPDYTVIGKIMALSLLQNGKLPRLLNPELVEEVFNSDSPRKFVLDLRQGLDVLGLFQIISKLPSLVHFFTAGNGTKLTMKMLINLLKPNFSPHGSNRRTRESQMYAKFLKYLREAAGGRKSADLRSVLRFVTGAEEEPCLGFLIHPSLEFVENDSFLPTANTCVHRLNLTIPADGSDQPPDEMLFNLFDYAFCNQFYGLK